MQNSGKLVILGILAVATASAVASWWFRYNATHRAAKFWGRQTALLIRDASSMELHQFTPPLEARDLARDPAASDLILQAADRYDVSDAPGITHLRNALLEDRSYNWPPRPAPADTRWRWMLVFRDDEAAASVALLFAPGWESTASLERPAEVLSCQPIADGLGELLGELANTEQFTR